MRHYTKLGLACLWALTALTLRAQESRTWDLKTCIEYARQQNIQIRQSRLSLEQSLEQTREAKAQRLPSLAFSSAHNYVNRPLTETGDKNSYTGSYNLNSSVTLYQGGQLKKNLQQLDLQNQMQALTVEEAENNIEMAITQAFVQVLYAHEAVNISLNTVEVSRTQRDRGEELMKAGSLSKADFAQLESQYTADQYQLIMAQSTLENARLDLKQLLELGIEEEMDITIPEAADEEVLALLPAKESVYRASLEVMPEVKANALNIRMANVAKEKAWAGYLPSLRLSAGIGTNHATGTAWGPQMKNNWSENIGLTLSVPVFSNRSVKTAVNTARLNIEAAELEYENVQKTLLKSIETVYQEAVSAQNRFRSAQENLNAARESFELLREQFALGMKNTLELLTGKNNLLTARLEVAQAKYTALLNRQLLRFYQGEEINL